MSCVSAPTARQHSKTSPGADGPRGRERLGIAAVKRPLALPVILPVVLLLVLTLVFRFSDADLQLCRLSYRGPQDPWPWSHAWICDFIYSYGTLPGLMLGIGGLIVGLAGLFCSRLRPYRRAGLFLALALALGPGLLVNGIFKPCWRRPRPHQTETFGGERAFVSVWGMGTSSGCKSFPSGHASMGFYLMVPAFLLYRRHGLLARACILLGLFAGLALGVTRVVQGAHFPSDVLWSAGFVYLTGLGLAGLFSLRIPGEASPVNERDAVRLRVAPDVTGSPEEISVPDIAEERETTRRDAA